VGQGQPDKKQQKAGHTPAAGDYDYTEAIQDNSDLVDRLENGDVHALASLIEAVTGMKVASSRIIERTR
jgi:hypothetical protein